MIATYSYQGPKRSKKPLVIDDKKALWLMRMCVGEGGRGCSREKAAALLWAITNRWFLWPGRRHYVTFLGLVRAFSQPINPRWKIGGDLAKKWFGRQAASKERLARRAETCALQRYQIRKTIRHAVEDFQDGELFPPEILVDIKDYRITNWASLKSTPRKNPQGFFVKKDWFFEDRNLTDGIVVVDQKLS